MFHVRGYSGQARIRRPPAGLHATPKEGSMASTVWKGHVTFGLVSFPVKLYSAARGESISFNQLHKEDNSRVKQVLYCQAEDKPIPRSEIVKGYEYEKDRYVVIDEEEIKKMAPASAKTMEILEFVKSSEVDPVYFESSYYMAPDEAGERPYALLFEALRRTGYTGVAQITMHNREHIALFRPGPTGLMMHTMYYAHEVRKVEEFRTDTTLVKDKELQLATMLIESLSAEFQPDKYRDAYRDNLQAMIEAKVQGREVVAPPAPETARVIDIMEALKQSLLVAKKPAGTADAGDAAAAEPGKRTRGTARKRSATG
jgi:DNA end-binding protein Ku